MKKGLLVFLTLLFLGAFLLFTAGALFYDLAPIGPEGTLVGYAGLNSKVQEAIGYNEEFLVLSDLLGVISLMPVGVFGLLGLSQWIKRKSLFAVDGDLFALLGTYVLMALFYVFFEMFVVNYRPVALEASYPSSHTVLGIVVLGTAILELWHRVRHKAVAVVLGAFLLALLMALVLGRTLSGVHWISDIIGGTLLSLFLVSLFSLSLDFQPR